MQHYCEKKQTIKIKIVFKTIIFHFTDMKLQKRYLKLLLLNPYLHCETLQMVRKIASTEDFVTLSQKKKNMFLNIQN